MKKTLLVLALVLCGAVCANAQSNAIVVQNCGVPPFPYAAGQIQPAVQDVNGNACMGGGSSATPITIGGNIGGFEFQAATTLTVQTSAYAAGNSEGGLVPLTAARTNGGSGILVNTQLRSAGGSTNAIWVYSWSKKPSATCTDKSTYVGNVADNAFLLPGFPQQVTLGSSPGAWDVATYGRLQALNTSFVNQDGTPSKLIYFCLVTAAAATPLTVTDLTLNANGIQD